LVCSSWAYWFKCEKYRVALVSSLKITTFSC
jgi:hypothetical protein